MQNDFEFFTETEISECCWCGRFQPSRTVGLQPLPGAALVGLVSRSVYIPTSPHGPIGFTSVDQICSIGFISITWATNL